MSNLPLLATLASLIRMDSITLPIRLEHITALIPPERLSWAYSELLLAMIELQKSPPQQWWGIISNNLARNTMPPLRVQAVISRMALYNSPQWCRHGGATSELACICAASVQIRVSCPDQMYQKRRPIMHRDGQTGCCMSGTNTLLTVAIAVYNAEPYLDESVSSIVAQDYTDWRMIIVDDGSTDGSGAIADAWAVRDPRICVIHTENQGPVMASNLAITECATEFIAFQDADDIALPDRLSAQLVWLQANPDLAAVGGTLIEWDPVSGRTNSARFPDRAELEKEQSR